MDSDEQRPNGGPAAAPRERVEPPAVAEPPEGQAPVMPAEGQPPAAPPESRLAESFAQGQRDAPSKVETKGSQLRGGSGRYLRTAAVSAAMLLFALAFFAAGYWLGDQRNENESGRELTASAADDPAWGPEGAAVTIEEYADFQCPYCAEFSQATLPALRDLYGDRLRYVFRDFPLGRIHPDAPKAAEAGQCAHDQGLFWEYHDHLFADQSALTVADLKRYASQVGADVEQFNECLDSGKNGWEVLLDLQDGTRAGVSGTPAFLINGILLPGVVPLQQFQAIIEQALAGAAD